MRHELKIGDEYLANLLEGRKKVEIRFNDRDYQVNDNLEFWNTETGCEIGEWVYFRIVHIHSGLGMQDGYVALSIEREEDE